MLEQWYLWGPPRKHRELYKLMILVAVTEEVNSKAKGTIMTPDENYGGSQTDETSIADATVAHGHNRNFPPRECLHVREPTGSGTSTSPN